jgi:hypothetical protein
MEIHAAEASPRLGVAAPPVPGTETVPELAAETATATTKELKQ